MKNRKVILGIVTDAMFIAILAVMSFVPYVGFIPLPGTSATLLHLVVLLGAFLFGKWRGLLYGTVFGLLSFIKAFSGSSPADLMFTNPLISILPRMLFGFFSGLAFDIFRKRLKFDNYYKISSLLAGFFTIFHTFVTLGCLYIFGFKDFLGITHAMGHGIDGSEITFLAFFGTTTLISASVEIALAFVVVPALGITIYRAFGKSRFKEVGLFSFSEEDKINGNALANIYILLPAAIVILIGIVQVSLFN